MRLQKGPRKLKEKTTNQPAREKKIENGFGKDKYINFNKGEIWFLHTKSNWKNNNFQKGFLNNHPIFHWSGDYVLPSVIIGSEN